MTDTTELIMEIHGDVKVLMNQVKAIEQHQRATNGSVADLKANDLRQEGALSMLKWLVGITLAMVSASAGVAAVVLAIVTQRGG